MICDSATPRRMGWLMLSAGLFTFFSVLETRASFEPDLATGRQLMQSVTERHQQYPYVYEEQTMVLIDRFGHRETRRLKRYSRLESNHLMRLLLLFESPEDVKGVAILAERDAKGVTRQSMFLPALGNQMVKNTGVGADVNFLGSDFSVQSLTGDNLEDYHYSRQRDVYIEDVSYFVVDVFPLTEKGSYPLHRHYLSKDHLYVIRTDYFDDLGRLKKRLSHHDLNPVLGDMWRANMLLMEDKQEAHQTLIKIDRRVFSADYVPVEMFTPDWLYNNYARQVVEQPEFVPAIDEAAEAELLKRGNL